MSRLKLQAVKLLAALGLALGLSACASMEPASRGALTDALGLSMGAKNAPQAVALAPQYDVADIRVSVPDALKVSEANLFYPIADIVWRGEPRGDRYAQVAAILKDGISRGTTGMTAGPKVIVEVEVTRFHALTEKTRRTFGGVHSIKFDLTVRDAATGQVIDGPRKIVADVKGAGGAAALVEEQAGRTQRVVIVEHLAQVIRRELSAHAGATEPGLAATSRLDSDLRLSPVPDLY
ncbi:MAG TPA: DUF6778 family protein [Paracoccaceae bacterium]